MYNGVVPSFKSLEVQSFFGEVSKFCYTQKIVISLVFREISFVWTPQTQFLECNNFLKLRQNKIFLFFSLFYFFLFFIFLFFSFQQKQQLLKQKFL